MRNLIVILALALLAPLAPAREAIWIEGEDAAHSGYTKDKAFHAVNTALLSDRGWLSHYNAKTPAEATWTFGASEGGSYVFWLRCHAVKATQQYRLNDGAFADVEAKGRLNENIDVAQPGADERRYMDWFRVGEVTLKKGKNRLVVSQAGVIANSGGVDCMCFVNFDWTPSAALKPDRSTVRRTKDEPKPEPSPAEAPKPTAPAAAPASKRGGFIWIEAENAARNTFLTKDSAYEGVDKDKLSANAWLPLVPGKGAPEAAWPFDVKFGGSYELWLRVDPDGARSQIALDDGSWAPVAFEDVLGAESAGTPQNLRPLGWVKAGSFEITPGRHTLKLRVRGKEKSAGALDCLVLVNFPWKPSGLKRPSLAGQ